MKKRKNSNKIIKFRIPIPKPNQPHKNKKVYSRKEKYSRKSYKLVDY